MQATVDFKAPLTKVVLELQHVRAPTARTELLVRSQRRLRSATSLEVEGVVHGVATSGDGKVVAAGASLRDLSVYVDDADGGWRRQQSLGGKKEPAWTVALSESGQLLVSHANGGNARVYTRGAQGYVEQPMELGAFASAVAVARDATSLWVARGSDAGVLGRRSGAGRLGQPGPADRLGLRARRGGPHDTYEGSIDFQVPVAAAADGRTVAVGFPLDSAVLVLRKEAGAWAASEVVLSPGLPASAQLLFGNAVSLSRDGRRLVVGHPDARAHPLVVFEER